MEDFIENCTTENIQETDLLIRFREDITEGNLTNGFNNTRHKLRDFLDNQGVQCRKGNGDSIQVRLLGVLSETSPYRAGPQSSSPSHNSSPQVKHMNTAKRDFLKLTRNAQDQFSGPYEGPIISAVKRRFFKDCNAFEVPQHQRLSVLHVMLKDDALRYFTDHVVSTADTVEEAFSQL